MVAGNVVYNMSLDGYLASMGTTFYDNIALDNGGAGYMWFTGGPGGSCPQCVFDYNLEWDTSGGANYGRLGWNLGPINFSAWKAANVAGTDAHSLNTDPLLVSPSTDSFLQTASSPGKGTGVAVSGMKVDLLGVTRPNPPSMGAYEYPN